MDLHYYHKYKKLLFVLTSIFFLFLFFVFSVIVKKKYLTQFDFDMAVRLQNHTPLRLDGFLSLFSFLASIEVMSGLLIILLLLRRKIISGICIFFIFLASHSVELFGKTFINHPPPPFIFLRHHDSSVSFANSYVQTGYSYPSGHSFRTIFVGLLVAYTVFQTKKLSIAWKLLSLIVIASIIILVCGSRISLGEHWTTDVIGGGIFGLGMGFFSLLFF